MLDGHSFVSAARSEERASFQTNLCLPVCAPRYQVSFVTFLPELSLSIYLRAPRRATSLAIETARTMAAPLPPGYPPGSTLEVVSQLEGMGFSRELAEQAVAGTEAGTEGGPSLQAALALILAAPRPATPSDTLAMASHSLPRLATPDHTQPRPDTPCSLRPAGGARLARSSARDAAAGAQPGQPG